MIGALRRASGLGPAMLALSIGLTPLPAVAQDNPEARLRKIEGEVRALQRKVFPDGAAKYFEPEIRAPAPTAGGPPPATGPVTDMLARVDALEAQLQRLTAQVEEGANRLGQLEGRMSALEGGAAPGRTGQPALDPSAPPSSQPGPAAAASGADAAAQRLAAVEAVVKPATRDPGEDEYSYGYRLWEARLYPEAAQQLQAMVKKHPRHARISYARNLLGRAYLDDGKPGTAAQVFLENYQADRKGARAPDSLLFLAVAMARLKENQRACVALQELADSYPQEVSGRLARDYASARAAVTCN